jgi:hypothetical protein
MPSSDATLNELGACERAENTHEYDNRRLKPPAGRSEDRREG